MDNHPAQFEMRVCTRPGCGLRFPLEVPQQHPIRCPRCRAETRLGLAWGRPDLTVDRTAAPVHLEGFLDNIRSAWNVGAIFRTADGLGVRHLHLSGVTATPEHPKVQKIALGAETNIPWTYSPNGLAEIERLTQGGKIVWGLEIDPRGDRLGWVSPNSVAGELILVVGNEISGVDPAILDLCDRILYVPMAGMKRSFNVAVLFGIAVYSVLRMAAPD